jgi:Domain of unknown function (DUF4190)
MPLVSSPSATPSKANSDGPVQAQPELYDSSFPVVQAQAAQGAPIQVAPPVVYASQLAANGAGGVVVVDSNNKFVGASMGSAAPPSYQQDKKNSGKAIASLVCAIVGLFVLGVVLGPVAIGLAVSAKNDIKRKPNELKGECMATSGLIIGIIGFVLSIIVIAMWASARAQAQAAASTYGYYDY